MADRAGDLAREIAATISFGIGRSNAERVEHALFDDTEAWRASDMGDYRAKAMAQLGTIGSGNHYVDLLRDEDGFVWIGCISAAAVSATPVPRVISRRPGVKTACTSLPE